jgi:hypothetical protein
MAKFRNDFIESNRRIIDMISKDWFYFAALVIFLAILFVDKGLPSDLDDSVDQKGLIIIIGISVTLFTIFVKYLESDKFKERTNSKLEIELRELRNLLRASMASSHLDKAFIEELKTIQKDLKESQTKGLELTEDDKIKLFELLETKLEKNLSQEFLETVQNRFGSEILAKERYSDLQRDLMDLKERLRLEIGKLSLRANVNLAIGSVTTLVAVFVLYSSVVSNNASFNDPVSIISYFVPRISLVIFIEVFAFFFLRLYKSNLENVRYYQNEMTSVESRLISLKAAISVGDVTIINEVIKQLSMTERNVIMKKGETTIDLEKLKYEKGANRDFIELVKTMLIRNSEK